MRKPNSVYDGFCHRPYDDDTDGWLLEMPKGNDYPAVGIAEDIMEMFNEIKSLRRENWYLRKQIERNGIRVL